MPSLPLVVALLMVALSAYFSGSETALFSLRSLQRQTLRGRDSRAARAVLALLEQPRRILATVLVGNTIAQVLLSVLAEGIFVERFGAERGPVLATFVSAVVMLVFGEILPKSMAIGAPLGFAIAVAPSLRLVQRLLLPLAAGAAGLSDALTALLERKVPRRDEVLSEDEIKMLVTMGWEQGVVGVREKEFIHNVFHLDDRRVEDIVTPRTRVFAADVQAQVEDVRHAVAQAGFSRVPLYEGARSNIVGYVEVSDLLWGNEGADTRRLCELRREMQFYPETMRVGELLLSMRRNGEEIAAVVDEHGAYDGIVAIEDAAVQVVGEIIDIHDLERFRITELEGGELAVSAQMEIGVFNTLFGAHLQDPDVETLGGLVSKRLGRVAQAGDQAEIGSHRFTVERAEPRRVVRLRVGRRGPRRRRDTERR